MTENIKKIINESEEIKSRYNSNFHKLISVQKYNCIIPYNNCWLAVFEWNHTNLTYPMLCYECCFFSNGIIKKHFSFLPAIIDNDYTILNKLVRRRCIETTIEKQIKKFKLESVNNFVYDFNHDGIDEIIRISMSYDTVANFVIETINLIDFSYKFILSSEISLFNGKIDFEFINFHENQGIKLFDGDNWKFYYYDRIKRKYVIDENASSEELEQIHGSPDFFAEAGIDYTKLERLLIPSDLEGFSKPALRIWRNAVYALHGRIFKSEDLQALFNEYAWYKPDADYSDDKLTDTDRSNIKLIQEFEKK